MDAVVVTHDLSKSFGAFKAVDRLNIAIREGEIYGFLGPNGAGKSTAIRMLCGILEPTSGRAEILGCDLQKDVEKIKSQIGYMSQKFSLYEDLTVRENLTFYAGIYGVPTRQRQARIQEMISMAGLEGREDELVVNLSGGWKQRLALGCSIIAKPRLIFLDEPTSGVSPTSRRMFFNIIEDLASQGITIMVTTHFMDEAERCHKIAFISAGRLMAVDTPTNLKKNTLEGYLVELELPNAVERSSELERLPYVRECSIHGPLLHVLLADQQGVEQLEAYTGVKSRPIIPSLEDVFLALAKKQRSDGDNR